MNLIVAAALTSLACNGPSGWIGSDDCTRPLFEDGRSIWVVAVPERAARPLLYAAEELTNALHKMSGAHFGVVTAETAPCRNVIRLEAPAVETMEDDFSVKTEPGQIVLRGNSPRGALFAAYAFLCDWLGVRWFWPGADGEFLLKLDRYDPPVREKTYSPPFALREMSLCSIDKHRHPDTERWCARMFMNCGINTPEIRADVGCVRRTSGHLVSLPVIMKERRALFAEHPDWFSLIDGKRDIEGIAGCWSNEGFFAYTVSNLVSIIHANKAVLANFFVADVVPRCECSECTKNPDKSARWWNYYARLIEAIRKEIPGMRFAGLAYQEYRNIPQTMAADVDHIEYCHYNRCFYHRLGDASCPLNARSMDEFRRWREKAPLAFYGYEFDVVSKPGCLYLPMWRLFADEMRVFRAMRLRRVKTELIVSMHRPLPRSQMSQYASRLPYYLWAKLSFDPDLDVDVLIDDFCARVYGNGASEMRAYHDLMADAWCGMKSHVTNYGTYAKLVAAKLITDELEKKARAYVHAAAEKVGDDEKASEQVALDLACFNAWAELAAESRKGEATIYSLKECHEDAVDAVPWLTATTKSGRMQPTRFKVYRGADALHVLAECRENDMLALNRGTSVGDAHDWRSPTIEFFIDIGDGAVRQIAVTPAGGVWDAKDYDKSWNCGAKVRPMFDSDKWILDMTFPYDAFGGVPKSGDRWKFMVIRNEGKNGFASCGWPVNAHRDFSSAATLVFK